MKHHLPKKVLLPPLAFLITNLVWGAAGPVIKYTLTYVPPIDFLFIRFLIVCIVLLPYVYMESHKIKVHKSDLLNLFLLGLFSQTSILITFYSLDYTTALDNTLIYVIGSIAIVWAGHYFYKEKVDSKLKIGLILASIGTFAVILEPILNGDHGNAIEIERRIWGNLLALVYSLTWVVYVIWSKFSMGERSTLLKKTLSFIHIKPMKQSYPPLFLSALTFYVGLVTMIPLVVLEKFLPGGNSFNISTLGAHGILGILYMALLSSIVAYMLNQWALDNGKASDAAIFGYVGIIFAFPVAYLLLNEIPNIYMIIGTAIIAVGVFIAETRNT